MRTGGERDYLYMLLYAGFLVSGCIALWRELRLRAMLAAALLPVAAALCDAWENWLLLDIQAAFTLGDYSPAMANLDRKSVGSGKRVSVRVDLGGRRIITSQTYRQDRDDRTMK